MQLNDEELKDMFLRTEAIIRQAGDMIMKVWLDPREITFKDKRDVSTETDSKVEEFLADQLKPLLPDAGFLLEEGVSTSEKPYTWVIDPIDGTKNFAYQLPMFVTQLALLENSKPILSHILQPLSNQLFSAYKKGGAYLNGKKITATFTNPISQAIIEIDFGGQYKIKEKMEILDRLAQASYRIRVHNAILYSLYLLTGAIDALVIIDQEIKVVDYEPYMILFEEAGLRFMTYKLASGLNIAIVANERLGAELYSLIQF